MHSPSDQEGWRLGRLSQPSRKTNWKKQNWKLLHSFNKSSLPFHGRVWWERQASTQMRNSQARAGQRLPLAGGHAPWLAPGSTKLSLHRTSSSPSLQAQRMTRHLPSHFSQKRGATFVVLSPSHEVSHALAGSASCTHLSGPRPPRRHQRPAHRPRTPA